MNYKFLAIMTFCIVLLGGGAFALRYERNLLSPIEAAEVYTPHPPVTIQFFGDVMLDRNVARNMGKAGLSYLLATSTTSSVFAGAELNIANLEGPFAQKRVSTSKAIAFRFDPALAAQLKKLNFAAFDLANNHSYDMGSANARFTRITLEKNGLHWFGDELHEGPTYTWYATSTDGTVLAFLGLHNTYHELDLKKVGAALEEARARAGVVIVNVHWGVEYRATSTVKQQTLAHWLIDHGADAIIGHHPHVVEELEIYKGKPVFYSLGNFIFDQYFSTPTQEGLSAYLTLWNGKIDSVRLIPFYGVKSQVRPMEGSRRQEFFKLFEQRSKLQNLRMIDGVVQLQ